jgi:PAS domain S-box-containing protein
MTTEPDVAAERGDGPSTGAVPAPLTLLNLQSSILHVIDTAIIAVDLTGVIVFANPAAAVLYGTSTEDLLGLSARRLMPAVMDPALETEIAGAIGRGESWEGMFEVVRDDGSVISVRAIDSPLYDGQGELVGIVSAGVDATRQRQADELAVETTRAAQVSQFLADCGTALASSIEYEDALLALARSSVPFLADLCFIDIAEAGTVRRVVATHHSPEQKQLVDELQWRYPPDPRGPHPAIEALRSGRTAVAPVMTDEFLRATTRDEQHYRIVKALHFQSYICVPLIARGRTLGAMTLVVSEPDRRFEDADLDLVKDVAWRAALVLDNARMLSDSSHVAQVLQASLMPPSLPAIPGIELAARYVAFGAGMEVGGDFYDVFSVGRRAWLFALGDVCGRGAEAAVVTGSIRHTLRSAAPEVRQPGRLMAVVNDVLLIDDNESHLFATVLCGILRPNASGVRLALANAGHPPPIVVRADGSIEMPRHGDTIVGAFADLRWATRTLVLHHGDLLVAYTDGITEARRQGELFGAERLAVVVQAARDRPIEEIADRVIEAVRAFAGHEPSDDLALIALRVRKPT